MYKKKKLYLINDGSKRVVVRHHAYVQKQKKLYLINDGSKRVVVRHHAYVKVTDQLVG
jgi:hypothetical protein